MSMDRRILLDALGWSKDHEWEGAMRWTKALSEDMLSSATLSVKQDACSARFELDREDCSEAFEPSTSPLLSLQFEALPNGRMALSKMIESGKESPLGPGATERAIGLAQAAQALFAGVRPKTTLLRQMSAEIKIGPKL